MSANTLRLLAAAALYGIVGCSTDSTAPAPPPASPVLVSNPVGVAAIQTDGRSHLVSGAVSYVSLPSGTVPSGAAALIRNKTRGTTAEVFLFAGGFDPVAVAADAGETIELDVRSTGGSRLLLSTTKVPARLRPIIVRTTPPVRKRDVPLNSTFLVVFSEPMNPATLGPGSIEVVGPSGAVSGRIQVGSSGTQAEFIPAAQLAAGSTYHLVVTTAVADLSGDHLEQQLESELTTASTAPSGLSQIAFSDCAVSQCALFVMRADGSGETQLTTGSARYPVWSPDGSKLAYFSVLSCTLTGGACVDDIYTVHADGSDVARLTHFSEQNSAARNPSWSPDGTRIVFSVSERNAAGQTLRTRLYFVNADGSGLAPLTDPAAGGADDMPAWSPDGSKIAFISNRNGGVLHIFVMNSNGSNPVQLTAGPTPDILPRWSPDSVRIAFSRVLEGSVTYQVYVMNADGSGQVPLTPPPDSDSSPTWSPDGSHLAFVRVINGARDLVVMRPTPGAPIISLLVGSIEGPAWSPFGTVPPFP